MVTTVQLSTPSDKDNGLSEKSSAKARYEKLATFREPYLQRARDASELTLPALMPRAGHGSSTELPTPWQSVGAEAVNSLSAKLLLALMPPGTSFFRLTLDSFLVEELVRTAGGGQAGNDARGAFESALGKVEAAITNRMEQTGARAPIFEGVKHLLVVGNVLLQVLKKGELRLHFLDNYVARRDPSGNAIEVIVRESVAEAVLPEAARRVLTLAKISTDGAKIQMDEPVELYTRMWVEDGKWKVQQEVAETPIPETFGTYPLDAPAFIPLRFTRIDGEDYGRGRVEEYIGDLRSADVLSQAIVEGTAIAVKTVWLRNPSGVTEAIDVQNAENGEIIDGDVRDIVALRTDKFADLQVAASTLSRLEGRIEKAFLVNQTRDAERVTAEEIRMLAAELEKTLGGIYSLLAQEMQLPLVRRIMLVMQKASELPALPKKLVSPQIVTGLEALGRSSDLLKLERFFAAAVQEFGPQALEYIKVGDALARKATAMQIDLDGLLRTEEEVQTTRQQQQQQAALASIAAPTINAASRASASGAATPPQPPTP